jgi:peptide deformylase
MKLHTQKLRILNAHNIADLKILKGINIEVKQITKDIQALISDMHFTLSKAEGLGLAAPQVGVNKRIFIIHHGGSIMTVINPVILYRDSVLVVETEGCLSIPNIFTPVPRSEKIRAAFTNQHGERLTDVALDGWLGRIFQHEYDHMEGKLIFNYSIKNGVVV